MIEMKKMMGSAGAVFKFSPATKMQKGMSIVREQHQMHNIPWTSPTGPVMQHPQRKRFLAGQISYIFGIVYLEDELLKYLIIFIFLIKTMELESWILHFQEGKMAIVKKNERPVARALLFFKL